MTKIIKKERTRLKNKTEKPRKDTAMHTLRKGGRAVAAFTSDRRASRGIFSLEKKMTQLKRMWICFHSQKSMASSGGCMAGGGVSNT